MGCSVKADNNAGHNIGNKANLAGGKKNKNRQIWMRTCFFAEREHDTMAFANTDSKQPKMDSAYPI